MWVLNNMIFSFSHRRSVSSVNYQHESPIQQRQIRMVVNPNDPIHWREGLAAHGWSKHSSIIVSISHDGVLGFGFELVGPFRRGNASFRNVLTPVGQGVYISAVYAASPASRSGIVRGLQVIDIDGHDLLRATIMDADKILSEASRDKPIELTLRPNPDGFAWFEKASIQAHHQPLADPNSTPSHFEYRTVVLDRLDVSKTLGIALVGPVSPDWTFEHRGVFITELHPDGLAVAQGGLLKYDQILDVNGISLTKATHAEAAKVLSNSGDRVYLLVASNKPGYVHQQKAYEQLLQLMKHLTPPKNQSQSAIQRRPTKTQFDLSNLGGQSETEKREGSFRGHCICNLRAKHIYVAGKSAKPSPTSAQTAAESINPGQCIFFNLRNVNC